MGRPNRIEFEGAWYHVMNRGNARQDIFANDSDRIMFMGLLKEISEEFSIEIHSYCLMDNHYHLLMRTPKANLGLAMKHLGSVYKKRYNIKHEQDGHVFKGRYNAILIEDESYLICVNRYIHLNPSNANITKSDITYRWSSYKDYVSPNNRPNFLYCNLILSHFDGCISRYINYIQGDSL